MQMPKADLESVNNKYGFTDMTDIEYKIFISNLRAKIEKMIKAKVNALRNDDWFIFTVQSNLQSDDKRKKRNRWDPSIGGRVKASDFTYEWEEPYWIIVKDPDIARHSKITSEVYERVRSDPMVRELKEAGIIHIDFADWAGPGKICFKSLMTPDKIRVKLSNE